MRLRLEALYVGHETEVIGTIRVRVRVREYGDHVYVQSTILCG